MTTNKVIRCLTIHNIEIYHGYAVEQYVYKNGAPGERFIPISEFTTGHTNIMEWLGY